MHNLYLVSLSLTIFFLILLLSKKRKRTHDLVLACWFGIVIINLFGFYLESIGVRNFVIEISSSVVFLHGVLLWFYTRLLIKSESEWTSHRILHFIPFLVHLAIVFPGIINGTLASIPGWMRETLMVFKITSLVVYLTLIVRDIRQHKRNIANQFSSLDRINLQWLNFLSYCILILIATGILSQVLKGFKVPLFVSHDDIVLNIFASVLIIAIGYFGFRQTPVFVDQLLEDPKPEKAKYSKSTLPEEIARAQYKKLESLLNERKIYRDPELSLNALAEALGLTPNHTSQIINTTGVNFFDLINRYRIEEIKGRLERGDAKAVTIESIAAECGFASRASFYRIFKKSTGVTPTEYLSSIGNQYQPSR